MSSYDQTAMPRWVPYIWLAYLTFFLWQPIAGPTSGKQWFATGLALVVFLFFYFTFFRTRIARTKGWLYERVLSLRCSSQNLKPQKRQDFRSHVPQEHSLRGSC